MSADTIADPIAFPLLSEDELAAIARVGTRRTTEAGETLYELGDAEYDFYVVLSGEIEVLVDSGLHEDPIVSYCAGQFLGELNLLTGLRTFVTARVVQDGEVLVVMRDQFRDLIATDPGLSDKILTAYIARRSNLLSLATSTTRVIGSKHAKESNRIREFLSRLSIPHEWLDPDKDDEVDAVLNRFGVERDELPIVISSGSVLRSPTTGQLSQFLGLTLQSRSERFFDLIVIGAGPAGLAACVYGASEGLSTLGVDRFGAGGQAGTTSRIENYLGFPTGLSGRELAQRALVQAEKFGTILTAPCEVKSVDELDGHLVVHLSDGTDVIGRALVAATGARYRRLTADRLKDFEDAGVFYAATHLEARSCASEPVVVVGGGNSAGQAATYLGDNGSEVTLVVRGPDPAAGMSQYLVERIAAHPNIVVRRNTEVTSLYGDLSLESVRVDSCGSTEMIPCAALFSFIGAEPASDWLPECVAVDDHGFVLTDRLVPRSSLSEHRLASSQTLLPFETSHPGVFAVGDIRAGSVKRVAAAVGEGSACVGSVHTWLSTMK